MREALGEAFGLRFWVLLPLLVGAILLSGLLKLVFGAVLRDPQDLFGQLMMSPVALLVPVLATVAGSTRLFAQLRWRFAVTTRTRESAGRYTVRRLLGGAVAAFVLIFTVTLVIGIIAFKIWPPLQPRLFDPGVYGLDPATVQADAVARESYSQLLVHGPVVYVAAYGLVLGCAAAALATLGNVVLLTVRPLWIGLLAPLVVFFVQSILAALSSAPYFGLLFALFPFGLDQQPLSIALLPVLVCLLLAGAGGWAVVARAPSLEQLR